MSIRSRLAALEKRVAARNSPENQPVRITFMVMSVVPPDDERFFTWEVAEQPALTDNARVVFGGAVRLFATTAEQFKELRLQVEASLSGRRSTAAQSRSNH